MTDEDYQYEVSGYGGPGVYDPHDNWVVEIVKGKDKNSSQFVKTFDTIFRLKHKNTGCYLYSHKVELPEWAFKQQEVTCGNEVLKENTYWRIERNSNSECKYYICIYYYIKKIKKMYKKCLCIKKNDIIY